jgi:hypothetical protein
VSLRRRRPRPLLLDDRDSLTGRSLGTQFAISPANTPFQDPLPIPPTLSVKTLSPAPTKSANIGAGEAARADHQRWDQFLPQKTYELEEVAVSENFYPAVDGVPASTTWRFRDTVNGNVSPLIRATYQEPIVVPIWNRLPSSNGGFGINQTSTHVHGGHNASLLDCRRYSADAEAGQDPLVEESPALAGITGASVLGHVALGRRAGARVWRLGSEPDAPWIASTGPRQAHLDGFDLAPGPHAELLIDRQGYIRAIWRGDAGGMPEASAVQAQVEKLNEEKSPPPFPDDHVH